MQKWNTNSQFKLLITFFTLITAHPSFSQTRSPNNLQGDLKAIQGSYVKEKGPVECPDGEFSVSNNTLTIGANLRITHINQGLQKNSGDGQSSCSDESQATFDGQRLQYDNTERCLKQKVISHYDLKTYENSKTKYIELKYKREQKAESGTQTDFSFTCLYSRDLKTVL